MLSGARLCGFVPTTDPAAAKAFYGDQLGLPILADSPFAVVFDAQGTPLRVTVVQDAVVAPYTVLGWEVPSITEAMTDLADRGIAFERFDGIEQDGLGVWSAPDGARIAWFKDPEGNLLSLAEGP